MTKILTVGSRRQTTACCLSIKRQSLCDRSSIHSLLMHRSRTNDWRPFVFTYSTMSTLMSTLAVRRLTNQRWHIPAAVERYLQGIVK